ncbi:MAG: Sua5/YciO/YrdC/YwlC family protein, partial [Armatimonadaceae bacterium]
MISPFEPEAQRRVRLVLTGTVQGIGLRPWLVRTSTTLGLGGSVENHGADVHLEWEGVPQSVETALETLRHHGPPGLRIASWDPAECPPTGTTRFEVGESAAGTGGWSLPPDLGPCADCLREMRDPSDRRFRYPFVSCTRCGPRWTVAHRTPWCRDNTTFARFPLCAQCQSEFTDPNDRRFHAETTACPACGPTLRWQSGANSEPTTVGTPALEAAATLLRDGGIVAVLGVGGFQLMVDATSETAVARLRERKHRPTKPLAVLFPDVETVNECAQVSPRECQVLEDVSRPIVLLDAKMGGLLAPNVAAGLGTIGAMLPMSPLAADVAEVRPP